MYLLENNISIFPRWWGGEGHLEEDKRTNCKRNNSLDYTQIRYIEKILRKSENARYQIGKTFAKHRYGSMAKGNSTQNI
jgi:hypothetical protein